MKKENYLHNIYRGNVEHCYGFQTAINKSLVEGRLYLSLKGLEGDECADLRHHGGLERALHQYPLEHYAYWQQQYSIDVNWIAPNGRKPKFDWYDRGNRVFRGSLSMGRSHY